MTVSFLLCLFVGMSDVKSADHSDKPIDNYHLTQTPAAILIFYKKNFVYLLVSFS